MLFISPPLLFPPRNVLRSSAFVGTVVSPRGEFVPLGTHPGRETATNPFVSPTCRKGGKQLPKEYRTHSEFNKHPDNAHLKARVLQVTDIDAAKEHVQITLDVTGIGLGNAYKNPGQFVQVGREVVIGGLFGGKKERRTCLLTIASAPGGDSFDFLVAKGCDPLKLAKCEVGEDICISPVMGNGLDCLSMVEGNGNIFVFVDAPQGFALAKSLIEWGDFRSRSGEGANRINHVNIYYAIPSGMSLPFANRFSGWSTYGANVLPLSGISIMEYLGAQTILGGRSEMPAGDFAVGCVATEETFESLYSALVMFGFRRGSVRKFTQEVVEREVGVWEEIKDLESESGEEGGMPHGMPQQVWRQKNRKNVEKEIWQSWVKVREEMKKEFERKWEAQSRKERDRKRSEEDKKQAWAAWCSQNKDEWSEVKWDNEQWGQYWSSWRETRESWQDKGREWSAGSTRTSGEDSKYKYNWNQQASQEYWDWVGKGAAGHERGQGKQQGSDVGGEYQDRYRRSQPGDQNGKSNWSGYQKGGYKYEYTETEGDNKSHNGYTGRNSAGGAGSRQGWNGWNRNTETGRRNGTGTGGGRKWGGGGGGGGYKEIDFYGVLGIDSGASRADIKKAYRRKAMQHHPDRNPDRNEEAHVKMKQIVVAWSVLKDENKRKRYDTYGVGGV